MTNCGQAENRRHAIRCLQVYNTGRSLGQFVSLLTEKAGKLALPDVLITAVGTKVLAVHCCQLAPAVLISQGCYILNSAGSQPLMGVLP